VERGATAPLGGNLTHQVSPDSGTTAQSFDTAGNLLTRTDARNQTAQTQRIIGTDHDFLSFRPIQDPPRLSLSIPK
jgi:YD repeat-containing protein